MIFMILVSLENVKKYSSAFVPRKYGLQLFFLMFHSRVDDDCTGNQQAVTNVCDMLARSHISANISLGPNSTASFKQICYGLMDDLSLNF